MGGKPCSDIFSFLGKNDDYKNDSSKKSLTAGLGTPVERDVDVGRAVHLHARVGVEGRHLADDASDVVAGVRIHVDVVKLHRAGVVRVELWHERGGGSVECV